MTDATIPPDLVEAVRRVLAAWASGRVTGAVNLGDAAPDGANALKALAVAFERCRREPSVPTHDEAWNM